MAGSTVDTTRTAECCYICINRYMLVMNHRCRCKKDNLYRASFAVCDEFDNTTEKEIHSAAELVTKPSDKWHL
jgi:hypothetical protein